MFTIYFDMDGVIADFDKRCDDLECWKPDVHKCNWNKMKEIGPSFWSDMEPIERGLILLEMVKDYADKHPNVQVGIFCPAGTMEVDVEHGVGIGQARSVKVGAEIRVFSREGARGKGLTTIPDCVFKEVGSIRHIFCVPILNEGLDGRVVFVLGHFSKGSFERVAICESKEVARGTGGTTTVGFIVHLGACGAGREAGVVMSVVGIATTGDGVLESISTVSVSYVIAENGGTSKTFLCGFVAIAIHVAEIRRGVVLFVEWRSTDVGGWPSSCRDAT